MAIILLSFSSLFFMIAFMFIDYKYKQLKDESQKNEQEQNKRYNDCLSLCNEVNEQNSKLLSAIENYEQLLRSCVISRMILNMTICAKESDYEKYTYFYNQLFFMGVPKDVLTDINKLSEFTQNCYNNKYQIIEGEKPFMYKFQLKEK